MRKTDVSGSQREKMESGQKGEIAMLRVNRIIVLLVLVALILSVCQPVSASPVAAPVAQSGGDLVPPTPRPDAPPYGQRGPYTVGVRDLCHRHARAPNTCDCLVSGVEPGRPRRSGYIHHGLSGRSGGRLSHRRPGAARRCPQSLLAAHTRWSSIRTAHGVFPAMGSFFTEHLASHGFVVMAPVHEDNWGTLVGASVSTVKISLPKGNGGGP